ncbi:MAG: hypothetical protein HY829_00750 [Actinobacteria bacterium]|nr:hypothetical protein [Actinomycetota bacterium]
MRWTAVVLAALALAGCTHTVPQPVTTTGGEVVVGLADAIRLSVLGTATTIDSPDPTCAGSLYRLHTSSGEFQAFVLRQGCTATDGTPENGNHGFYPSVPAGARTDQVSTPLGPATVFSNQYSECTTSCYMGTDEVALVPVAGRVVQIVAVTTPASGTTQRDRAALVAVLQGLRRA